MFLLRSLGRSLYHRHPLTGMMITGGLVNAMIGGANDRPGLFTFGLVAMGLALGVRWVRWQRLPAPHDDSYPHYYLPPAEPRPALPRFRSKSSL